MKIGIFGGSFNPPHKMHKAIGEYLIKNDYVDKVIYVPTTINYKYKNNLVSDAMRLKMLSLMLESNTNMEVSDYELRKGKSYTYDTLKYFKKIYHSDQVYFICGADNISYVDKWKKGIELLKEQKFIVLKREGSNLEEILDRYREYKDNFIVAEMPITDISSTMIREIIQDDKKDAIIYLDDKVSKFIRDNNLYQKEKM